VGSGAIGSSVCAEFRPTTPRAGAGRTIVRLYREFNARIDPPLIPHILHPAHAPHHRAPKPPEPLARTVSASGGPEDPADRDGQTGDTELIPPLSVGSVRGARDPRRVAGGRPSCSPWVDTAPGPRQP